jgi:formate-dependent nitrite reductase membrane component NrfD
MQKILEFLAREPAMVVAVALAIANMLFTTLTSEQALQVQTIVESALVLIGGAVIRENVTPTAKLP